MSDLVDMNLKVNLPALEKLAAKLANRTPVHRMVAGTMADKVEENFARQGRPDWMPLAPATRAARAKRGTGSGKILQESGALAASVSAQADANSATVGSNLEYAAIHQLGGQAGRNRAVTIPARPYLRLTEADAREITDEVNDWVMRL